MDPEIWYSTKDIVELGRKGYFPYSSLSSIYLLIQQGHLSVIRKGNRYLIQGKELLQFASTLPKRQTK